MKASSIAAACKTSSNTNRPSSFVKTFGFNEPTRLWASRNDTRRRALSSGNADSPDRPQFSHEYAAHIHIHRTRRNKSRIAPNRIQQVIAAEYPAWVARQVVKQAKLRGSRSGELTAHRQLHGARVDDDLFKAEDRRRSWTLEATQDCLDASHQLPRGEWLRNVVIGA